MNVYSSDIVFWDRFGNGTIKSEYSHKIFKHSRFYITSRETGVSVLFIRETVLDNFYRTFKALDIKDCIIIAYE